MKRPRLTGKVAVVTGASSGIGKAIALALAAEGAGMALGARRVELLEQVAAEVEAQGSTALAVQTDVTRQADIDRLVARTLERWGRIDILVANAGVYIRTPWKNCRWLTWNARWRSTFMDRFGRCWRR
jgi:NADP-dependent 3-hydroxy acid dehydrogenase YdfG